MAASCHRRAAVCEKALTIKINDFSRFPDNVECLKFLTRLCTDLGMPDAQEYASKLKKLERVRELRDERRSMSGGSGGRVRTSMSAAGSRARSGTARLGSRESVRTASAHIDLTNVNPKDYRITNPRDIDTSYSSSSIQSAERRKERPRTGAQRINPDDDFQFDDVDDSMLPE